MLRIGRLLLKRTRTQEDNPTATGTHRGFFIATSPPSYIDSGKTAGMVISFDRGKTRTGVQRP